MSLPTPTARGRRRISAIGVPLAVVGIVILLVVPIPTPLLDLLLAANITIAVLVLLTSMMVRRALDFSVFPALLLVTTLARLSLNVSSTRLILLDGEAGDVIESFGNFVIGGNLVVGLVVFLILVIIQFAVITAGAGRVSEVAARFTLDAMPGKQMAIDADLNAGLIDENQARKRRDEIAAEADFYGAMDGASKFVKGDAIAGVILVLINLIAGMAIGVLQMGLPLGEAVQKFSLLSVGDGLVSQIPALLISVASGLLVTRVASADGVHLGGGLGAGFGGELVGQLLRNPMALRICGVLTLALGLMPGLPKLPFFALSAGLFIGGFRVAGRQKQEEAEAARAELAPVEPSEREQEVSIEQLTVDPLRLDLASDLLDLLDPARGDLPGRVKALRKRVANDLGIIVPPLRTADDPLLPPTTYAVRVNGVEVARGEAPVGCSLVLDDGSGHLPGRPTVDPVFGTPAVWMQSELADTYRLAGLTVVDRASVVITHLGEVVRTNAADLLTRQSVRTLLDAVEQVAPVVAKEVDGDRLTLAEVQRVLADLLAEGVPVRNLTRILEAVATKARETRSSEQLVEAARVALGPVICTEAADGGVIHAVTFDPSLEAALLESVRNQDSGSWLALDGIRLSGVLEGISEAVLGAEDSGVRPVIVCAAPLRPSLRRMVATSRPDLRVLSYAELARSAQVTPVGEIRLPESAVHTGS